LKKIDFEYEKAFKRNLGLVSLEEQEILKSKVIGIVGMGGVGSNHLINFVRMGLEKFKISDYDNFDIGNTNRQYGATIHTYGQSKVEVMAKMAKDINPNVQIEIFPKGINDQNLDEFMEGVDLYVDSIDAFVIQLRRKLFMKAFQKKIWSITAGPLGFSSAWVSFSPEGISFEEYFQIDSSTSELDGFIRFISALSPKSTQASYMDYAKIDFSEQAGPSMNSACLLCSAVMGTHALKIFLKRGNVYPAPYYHQFDPYLNKYVRGKLWFGNRSPFQKNKIKKLTKFLKNKF
jgi:sulfur-carrier protein adenylyltransferase/sulfurtransferase